ncbi:hypothetical protein ASG72_04145 [Bosea sp. Leaf344]|nr:hypothetical protein ASG72_04145 [Bosea sp. Leaf344]
MGESGSKIAVISGGSSGIGLACARQLLSRDYDVVLLARDPERLRQAKIALEQEFKAAVNICPVDVDDGEACAAAIATIMDRHGRIDWLITSAGIVEPGMFLDLDLAAHQAQMRTNYFGTLHLVQAAARVMMGRPGSKITMIASAAAFVGIIGYSGYAPGKFAVRALGEVLRLELEPHGISVSVAFPPDTDTPQLHRENLTRPLATRLISQGGGVMSATEVAERIIRQAEAGRFLLAPSPVIALLAWSHSFYAPIFAWQQRRILRRVTHTRTDRS